MKLKEKEFRIYEGNRPKVLLLGNGLCRAYGGMSWNRLLDEIKDRTVFPHPAHEYVMPMPLKAAMLANNTLARKLRDIIAKRSDADPKKLLRWQNFVHTTSQMRAQICRLLNCGFDYVLTTNYSYEIEASLLGVETLSPYQLSKLMNFYEIDNAQTQFLMNTFNLVNNIPIFHIHGEARKPDSIVLSHYYYGKLLRRCVERLDGTNGSEDNGRGDSPGKSQAFRKNIKDHRPQKIGSWADAFVLGDVYILGFGLDFSEADLWWLIEYKNLHPDICGKTYFFDPKKAAGSTCEYNPSIGCDHADGYISSEQSKLLFLEKIYRVETKDLGVTAHSSSDYQTFYSKAIAEFENM